MSLYIESIAIFGGSGLVKLRGILSLGDIVLGDIVRGGYCPWGILSGGGILSLGDNDRGILSFLSIMCTSKFISLAVKQHNVSMGQMVMFLFGDQPNHQNQIRSASDNVGLSMYQHCELKPQMLIALNGCTSYTSKMTPRRFSKTGLKSKSITDLLEWNTECLSSHCYTKQGHENTLSRYIFNILKASVSRNIEKTRVFLSVFDMDRY